MPPMSREAIAAVMARDDLAAGERLVALALASYASRENRTFVGSSAAMLRAGLGRRRYEEARARLIARGLLIVDERATGRGRSSTVSLALAGAGPSRTATSTSPCSRRCSVSAARPAWPGCSVEGAGGGASHELAERPEADLQPVLDRRSVASLAARQRPASAEPGDVASELLPSHDAGSYVIRSVASACRMTVSSTM
jgi:hypothetical protein